MTMNAASLQASFNAVLKNGTVSPITEQIVANLNLYFNGLEAVRVFNGKFCALNNYRYVFQGLTALDAPTFIIILCDGRMNLVVANTGGGAMAQSVRRFFFLATDEDAMNFIQSLFIDGRTSSPSPMVQNEEVNYTIIIGKASVR